VYAYGMYDKRQYALSMGIVYAIFVTFNIFLFPVFEDLPFSGGLYVLFAVASLAGAYFPAWLMYVQRDDLVL